MNQTNRRDGHVRLEFLDEVGNRAMWMSHPKYRVATVVVAHHAIVISVLGSRAHSTAVMAPFAVNSMQRS